MGLFSDDHPYSAVTQWIDRLTGEQYADDDLDGLPELCDTINLQSTGPTEASRALRKKLKYGNVHSQLRALTILKTLVDNCGTQFQRTFANERLMERLKIMATDPLVDERVHQKLLTLLQTWSHQFKDDRKMYAVAHLYDAVGRGKKKVLPPPIKSHGLGTEANSPTSPIRPINVIDSLPSPPSSASALINSFSATSTAPASRKDNEEKLKKKVKDKKKQKIKPFNWQKEKSTIVQEIAIANQNANNLINKLKLINREQESVMDDEKIKEVLEKVKVSRNNIVRYTRLVEDEDWIGTLVQTNDALLYALQMYEQYSKSILQDSDDDEVQDDGEMQRIQEILAKMSTKEGKSPPPALPSRRVAVPGVMDTLSELGIEGIKANEFENIRGSLHPSDSKGKSVAIEPINEDDPFADPTTPVLTPFFEKERLSWTEV